MVNKIFSSLGDNLLKKTTNPFLGTFILVWVIHNWKFVYSLFYFDSNFTLEMKIKVIESYFSNYVIWDTLSTILIAVVILASTYILLNISRLIVNFFEKKVTPLVYQITDKSSVVLKSDYVIAQSQIESLNSKVQEEKELRLKAQGENERLEKRIGELLQEDPLNILSDKVNAEATNPKKTSSKADFLFELITKEGQIQNFDQLSGDIKSDHLFDKKDNQIQYFVKIGLIIKNEYFSGSGNYSYNLTAEGDHVLEKILRSKLNKS